MSSPRSVINFLVAVRNHDVYYLTDLSILDHSLKTSIRSNKMAKNETKRLVPSVLADDEASFNALKKIPDYAPSNPSYKVDAIEQAKEAKQAAQAAEDQAAAALKTARDVATSKEWAFHNLILGAKDHVRGQYGKDSVQVQEIGLKRTSEYKSRGPRRKETPK